MFNILCGLIHVLTQLSVLPAKSAIGISAMAESGSVFSRLGGGGGGDMGGISQAKSTSSLVKLLTEVKGLE